MNAVGGVLLATYFAALGALGLYGVHRLALVLIYWRSRSRAALARPRRVSGPAGSEIDRLPVVTVQLPIFNEMYVLDRLVEAACALRYPRHLLEIQILDDSTDATATRARDLAAEWRAPGHDIAWLRRPDRSGFKAGALAFGLTRARGEFVAIFDADFVPPPDFLERTLPHFADPEVGMVQARWGHLNREHSLLTRAQALLLDGHFVVEQAARAASGRYFNFNGTAGIFRRACIEEAGGWQADTLTEDLDISYRAQMAGWRFVFLSDLACPAELPVEVNALRSQQQRWAKGSIQTARKILPALLRSAARPAVKMEALFHLTNNVAYLLLFLVSVLLVPSLAIRRSMGWSFSVPDLAVFAAGTGSFALFCLVSQGLTGAAETGGRGGIGWMGALRRAGMSLPLLMALGAGLALNNALAVLQALVGRHSEFRRTPKHRIEEDPAGAGARRAGRKVEEVPAGGRSAAGPGRPARSLRPWQALAYHGDPTRLAYVESLLAAFFLGGMVWAFEEGLYASLPFLALFAAGYGYVAGLTFAQGLIIRLWQRRLAAAGTR